MGLWAEELESQCPGVMQNGLRLVHSFVGSFDGFDLKLCHGGGEADHGTQRDKTSRAEEWKSRRQAGLDRFQLKLRFTANRD